METTTKNFNNFNPRRFLRSVKKAFRIRRDSIKSVREAIQESSNKQSSDDYDYVGEEPLASSNSLYHCEMPVERIKKLKAQRDSMSRLEGLPLGVKSCFPTVDKSKPKYVKEQSISTRPVLVTADVFARGRYGNSDSVKDDYLDMEDPPNFDDFMYLRWEEPPTEAQSNKKVGQRDGALGTPPPPYSELGASPNNYIIMFDRRKASS